MCSVQPQKNDDEVEIKNQLGVAFHFACPIYLAERPDFLKDVSTVSDEYLKKAQEDRSGEDELITLMTEGYHNDERLRNFTEFVGVTAWDILKEQGYEMEGRETTFMAMWTQEHNRHSLMEQHVHGDGAQIVGFYFLETPAECSRLVVHDPRAGKLQIDMPEQDPIEASVASRMINFEPKPGLIIFTNAWLAHSFSRHMASKPLKFVHFNLSVKNAAPTSFVPAAEVI